MRKKGLALLTILFFVILTSAAFAQSSAPSDQQTRPGPGYAVVRDPEEATATDRGTGWARGL